VPDLAETYDYYHDVLGLEEECREGDSVYLRGWGDFNKFSLTLTEAEESGVGHIAFRVEEPADLERYAERVEDSGYDVEWREAGADPGTASPSGLPDRPSSRSNCSTTSRHPTSRRSSAPA